MKYSKIKEKYVSRFDDSVTGRRVTHIKIKGKLKKIENLNENDSKLFWRLYFKEHNEVNQANANLALKRFSSKMVKNGTFKVEIQYYGSGDSGEMDTIKVLDGGAEMNDVDIEQLREIAYEIPQYDWVNNEGGNGTITIDFKKRTWEVDAYQNREFCINDEIQTLCNYQDLPIREEADEIY